MTIVNSFMCLSSQLYLKLHKGRVPIFSIHGHPSSSSTVPGSSSINYCSLIDGVKKGVGRKRRKEGKRKKGREGGTETKEGREGGRQ